MPTYSGYLCSGVCCNSKLRFAGHNSSKVSGFTLLESVIAMLIILIMLLSIVRFYATGQNLLLKSKFRTEAVKLAQATLEERRVDSSPSNFTSCNSSLGGGNYYYNINFTATKPSLLATVPPDSPPTIAAKNNLYKLEVTVTGPYKESSCTNLTPGNVRITLVTLAARQSL